MAAPLLALDHQTGVQPALLHQPQQLVFVAGVVKARDHAVPSRAGEQLLGLLGSGPRRAFDNVSAQMAQRIRGRGVLALAHVCKPNGRVFDATGRGRQRQIDPRTQGREHPFLGDAALGRHFGDAVEDGRPAQGRTHGRDEERRAKEARGAVKGLAKMRQRLHLQRGYLL